MKKKPCCRKCDCVLISGVNWFASSEKYSKYICKVCETAQFAVHQRNNKERYNEYRRAWRRRNPGRAALASKRWRQENPERYRELNREGRARNANRYSREYHSKHGHKYVLKRYHNLTPEDYAAMFERQGRRCRICLLPTERRLCVDHNHKDGHIRGLLCSNCNRALGYFHDDLNIVNRALYYLLEDSASIKPI